MTEYDTILVAREGRVGQITLNRPQALNALNSQVMHEVTAAAKEFDNDPEIGAILLTGYLGGAILTHLRVGDFNGAHIVFGVILWGGLWLRDPRLRALMPFVK